MARDDVAIHFARRTPIGPKFCSWSTAGALAGSSRN
jgi:hypothetical protein